MATLTIRGKVPVVSDRHALANFRKCLALMLAIARQDAKLSRLSEKQSRWLTEHQDHDLYDERREQHVRFVRRLNNLHTDLHLAKCHTMNAICDLQTATLEELSAIYGSEVTIASPEAWMLAAFHSPDASDEDVLAGKVAPF